VLAAVPLLLKLLFELADALLGSRLIRSFRAATDDENDQGEPSKKWMTRDNSVFLCSQGNGRNYRIPRISPPSPASAHHT
jgi:hypothetical protein